MPDHFRDRLVAGQSSPGVVFEGAVWGGLTGNNGPIPEGIAYRLARRRKARPARAVPIRPIVAGSGTFVPPEVGASVPSIS